MHDHCLYAGLSRGMTVLLTKQPTSDRARPSKATMRRLGGKVLQGLGRRLVAAGEALAGDKRFSRTCLHLELESALILLQKSKINRGDSHDKLLCEGPSDRIDAPANYCR